MYIEKNNLIQCYRVTQKYNRAFETDRHTFKQFKDEYVFRVILKHCSACTHTQAIYTHTIKNKEENQRKTENLQCYNLVIIWHTRGKERRKRRRWKI